MIVQKFNSREKWLEGRKAKIMGSKLGDIYSPRSARKIGFYELIADRLAIVEETDETERDRGLRLEAEAIEALNKERKLKLIPCDNTIWVSEADEDIAISPDGHNKSMTEAVEVKCLKASLHLQAIIENKIRSASYQAQAIQYFIVNEKLEKVYFVFYNPNVTSRPLHIIDMVREDFEDDIEFYEDFERQTLKEVDEWVERLAF